MHYLLGSLLLLIIWLLIFLFKKNLRKEMLFAGFLVTPAAFSEVFFVPDYWLPDTVGNPKLSIEDFIFSFAVGGIIAVIYELFMKNGLKHQRLCNCFSNFLQHGLILTAGLAVIFFLYFLFHLNFMYAVYAGTLADIILMGLTRPDLIKKMFYSGLVFGLFYFFFFSLFSLFFPDFIRHWNLKNLSGVIIAGVPLKEVFWAIGAGSLLGPIYEYLLSIKLVKNR